MKPSNDHEAIALILEGITKAGCTVTQVMEDTWCPEDLTSVSTVAEAVALVCGVDEAYVYVNSPEDGEGWIRFVLGNDPEEVVCDHTINLSEFIDPITDPWWD